MSDPARGRLANPVLPCDDLDVEVVSDVIEELDDIEVVAQPREEPEPDVEVVAVVEEEVMSPSPDDQEPDYDVDVACEVQDAEEPDLDLAFSVTDDSN